VIVTLVPESDFTAEIAAGRRRSTWFALGAVLGTIGLGVLLASAAVRPILELSRHVRGIGEGQLEGAIHLPYARELVRLSEDINRMTADLRDRMALRRSLAMAMEVQQSLLPSEVPKIEGLDIAGHSTYCDETGGDYYDYLDIADLSSDTAALVVGDVVGHGIAAAMLMATARGILRSRCVDGGSLDAMLEHLNTLLVDVTGGERFMTMVLVTIDSPHSILRVASAGHDPPFIYDPVKDEFIELDVGGLPLGIMEDEEYREATCGPLAPGTIILASTDGVWEAQNEEGEDFGKDRVREIVRRNAVRDASGIAEALREEVRRFCGEAKQIDDITFVVAKCVPAG
jgi:phosphoserine phosphatase RsbU/P